MFVAIMPFIQLILLVYSVIIITSASITTEDVKLETWSLLGPFLIGKTEIDSDPLENLSSCSRVSILRKEKGCPKRFLSEISTNGYVTWNKLISTVHSVGSKIWYQVQVSFPSRKAPVDYNALIIGMNKISVLEFQAWLTTTISISNEGLYEFNCDPIHSFYLDGVLYAGDVYSRGISNNFIQLTKGKHFLDIRVRGKGSATFKCFVKRIALTSINTLQLIEPHLESGPTDIVNGELPFSLPSWLQLPLTNAGPVSVYNITAVVVNSKLPSSSSSSSSPSVVISQSHSSGNNQLTSTLIPHHTQFFAFSFQLDYPLHYKADWWKPFLDTDNPCLAFDVHFTGRLKQPQPYASDVAVKSNSIRVSLQCRHALQSFLFTFPDHDGSIVRAGALLPRAALDGLSPLKSSKLIYPPPLFSGGADGSSRYPVLLTLSGVGVSTRSQVDAHKYKSKPSDKDYTFGLQRAWVLAPCRDGAHNWEGTGYQTAIATVEYLLTATAHSRIAADGQAVMVSGHSRGGHGALTVATHVPDRIRAIVSASGYADRESYGDANILFDLDLQLAYMDPLMLAIHLATIHEYDNLQLADNLRGKNAFIRAGGADRTVNPFFQRQIARVLSAEGVNITYSEKPGADHWYWDFDLPEDGGECIHVFDPTTRRFIEHNLQNNFPGAPAAGDCDGFTVSSFNPATVGAVKGIRILQMISRIRKARVTVQYTSHTTVVMNPSNVRKFLISASFWEHCSSTISSGKVLLVVGGSNLRSIDTTIAVVEDINICRDDSAVAWTLCGSSSFDYSNNKERGPSNYGPARQVNHAPFVIVVGSGYPTAERYSSGIGQSHILSNDLVLNAARYLCIGHAHASASIAPVVMDEDITENILRDIMTTGTNLILLGGPHVNSVSKRIAGILDAQRTPLPITLFPNSTIQLGCCRFNQQQSDGVMFTFPTPYSSDNLNDTCDGGDAMNSSCTTTCTPQSEDNKNFRNHLSMMISADTLQSLYDVISFSFSSNVPLTRAPFSNMFADYYITSREVGRKGYGGLSAVGFWGNKWEYQPHQGWTATDCG